METRAEDLLAAVLATPDDIAPRLVYADFLQERGDPRGEFIQLSCALDDRKAVRDAKSHRKLELRHKRLLTKHAAQWASPFAAWFDKVHWRRGFVEGAVVRAPAFPAALREALRSTPLRHVSVTAPYPTNMRAMAAAPELLRLSSLDLSYVRVGPAEIRLFAESPYLARIARLGIAGFYAGIEGTQALCASPYLGDLRDLALQGELGGDDAAVAVASAGLALRRLSLRADTISAAGTRALCEAPSLAQLTVLDLKLNDLADAGAIVLAEARLEHLRELDLATNHIHAAGALALARTPGLPRLTTLNFAQNFIGDEAQAALAARFATVIV